jgi:hypothetical protein
MLYRYPRNKIDGHYVMRGKAVYCNGGVLYGKIAPTVILMIAGLSYSPSEPR